MLLTVPFLLPKVNVAKTEQVHIIILKKGNLSGGDTLDVKNTMQSGSLICPPENPNPKEDGGISVQTIYPGSVPLSQFYIQTLHGDYEAAGVGLQFTNTGQITIGNIPAGSIIEKAFLYWAVSGFTGGNVPVLSGELNGISIVPLAQQIGVSIYQNYFFFDVYRADVTGIAQFGNNTLTNFSFTEGYNGATGASLVVVYSNPNLPLKTVVINDGALLFDFQTVSTTLSGFTAGGTPFNAKTTYIVGAGDSGLDDAYFNNEFVAGPDAFNSADGLFWDTLNADVTDKVNPGDTSAEASIISNGDVLVYIAQILSVTIPEPNRGVDISMFEIL